MTIPQPQRQQQFFAKHSDKPTAGYLYSWRGLPSGVKKQAASPIDALLEVLMLELKISSVGALLTDLDLDSGAISRCRHRKQSIPHIWLLRAAVLANIPYGELCAVIGEERKYWPHHNAKELA